MAARDGKKPEDEELALRARVQALLERGLGRYARGDVAGALSDWEHALALDPSCTQAVHYIREGSRNLETMEDELPPDSLDDLDGLFPIAAEPSDVRAPSSPEPPAPAAPGRRSRASSTDRAAQSFWANPEPTLDDFYDSWPLYDDVADLPAPPVDESLADELRAVNEALLDIAREEQAALDLGAIPASELDAARTQRMTSAQEDQAAAMESATSRTTRRIPVVPPHVAKPREPAAESWGDTRRRVRQSDGYTSAFAPTVELIVVQGQPASAADLGDTEELGGEPPAAEPHQLPPVIIEETERPVRRDTEASPFPFEVFDDGSGALAELTAESTAEHEKWRLVGSARSASRPSTLELANTGPDLTSTKLAAAAAPGVIQRLLDELGEEVLPGENEDEALRRRVSWFIERARSAGVEEDYDLAITAVELALDEAPDSAVSQKLIHRHLDTLHEVYERYIGDPVAVPELAVLPSELRAHQLDNRAAFLLSRIDGMLTVEELLDVSGMTRLEAFRHLCGLLRQGIVRLR